MARGRTFTRLNTIAGEHLHGHSDLDTDGPMPAGTTATALRALDPYVASLLSVHVEPVPGAAFPRVMVMTLSGDLDTATRVVLQADSRTGMSHALGRGLDRGETMTTREPGTAVVSCAYHGPWEPGQALAQGLDLVHGARGGPVPTVLAVPKTQQRDAVTASRIARYRGSVDTIVVDTAGHAASNPTATHETRYLKHVGVAGGTGLVFADGWFASPRLDGEVGRNLRAARELKTAAVNACALLPDATAPGGSTPTVEFARRESAGVFGDEMVPLDGIHRSSDVPTAHGTPRLIVGVHQRDGEFFVLTWDGPPVPDLIDVGSELVPPPARARGLAAALAERGTERASGQSALLRVVSTGSGRVTDGDLGRQLAGLLARYVPDVPVVASGGQAAELRDGLGEVGQHIWVARSDPRRRRAAIRGGPAVTTVRGRTDPRRRR